MCTAPIYWIDSCASTNDYAWERLERRGATEVEATCYATLHQTAGRGRRGHTWQTPPGQCLALSYLHFPVGGRASGVQAFTGREMGVGLGLMSLTVAYSLVLVLERYGLEVQIKWPNDILLGGQKVAGVLIEIPGGLAPQAMIIGIGLNIALAPIPEELVPTATSLHLHKEDFAHQPAEKAHELAQEVQGTLFEQLGHAQQGGDKTELLREIESRCAYLGRHIEYHLPESSQLQQGRAVGLGEDGALLVETEAGSPPQALVNAFELRLYHPSSPA